MHFIWQLYYVTKFRYFTLLTALLQARWRGAVVRNSMRKVCRDYVSIFDEIEQKPSCSVEWHLAKRAVVAKPQFLPLYRRNCLRFGAPKSAEPVNSASRNLLVQNCISGELQPVNFGSDSTRTNLELTNSGEPATLVPETHTNSGNVSPADLPSTPTKQQETELDACSEDNHQNCEDIFVDHTGNRDSVTVVSSVPSQENFQASGTGVSGTVVLSVLLNFAGFVVRHFEALWKF